MTFKTAALIGAAACAMTCAAPALARPAPGAPSAPVVLYQQSIAPLGEDVEVLGAAPADAPVEFQVALHLRNAEALSAGNAAGRVLTPAQLEAGHLPTQADYDRVANWLRAAGLTVKAQSPERLMVEASGSAAQVALALGVHFSRVQSEGEAFVSADTAPAVPAALAGVVQSINGLQPHLRVHPMGVVQPLSATKPPLYPQAFLDAYLANGIGDGGKGSTTAIVIDTFPLKSDLTKFWTAVGSTQTLDNIDFIQVVSGTLPKPSGEESMDVEVSSAIAPKSRVRVYASRTLSDANLDKVFNRVISDIRSGIKITQVSISLGGCESANSQTQAQTDDNLFAVMSSLGASVMVSSGDSGSKECGKLKPDSASFYATSPNVTAVGGTTLTLRAAGTPPAETSWKGSGGGVSVLFRRPDYQTGLGYKKRIVPDVAADANPNTGALVVLNGRNAQYGGTSLSAPIWAGLLALVNADRLSNGKTGLGLLNGRVYPMVNTTKFRDITVGTNGGFDAGPGYDLVTGLGAPIMEQLAPALAAQP